MSDILIRGLDESVLLKLKARASGNGRSLNAELKAIIEQESKKPDRNDFLKRADELKAQLVGWSQPDGVSILREDRHRDQ